MFTTNHASQNRLLALDQDLLGWKQASPATREELLEDLWAEDTSENADPHVEEIAWDTDEWNTDDAVEDYTYSAPLSSDFSYSTLAARLQSRTRRLGYSTYLMTRSTQSDRQTPIIESAAFDQSDFRESDSDLPAIDLPPLDLPGMNLRETHSPKTKLPDLNPPDAAPPKFPSVARSEPSENRSSYQSLLQIIQAARQRDNSEDESFSAQSSRTIDVQAQAITDSQESPDELLNNEFSVDNPLDDFPINPYPDLLGT